MGRGKIIDKNGKQINVNVALHPGEILSNELESRQLTKGSFAIRCGMYPSQLSDILKGKRNITAYIALKLEAELEVPAEFWLELQMEYDLRIEREKMKESA